MEEACKFLSLAINNGTITGRGYLWVLSLQIFVIDHGTMTRRGYLWVLSLQIKN